MLGAVVPLPLIRAGPLVPAFELLIDWYRPPQRGLLRFTIALAASGTLLIYNRPDEAATPIAIFLNNANEFRRGTGYQLGFTVDPTLEYGFGALNDNSVRYYAAEFVKGSLS